MTQKLKNLNKTKTKIKQCRRCGKCCQSQTLLELCTEEEKNLFKLIYKIMGKDINNTPCPHLEFRMGIAICKIYKDRPQFCRDFYCENGNEQ